MEKVSLLKQMPQDWLLHQIDSSCSLKELPYAGLISSSIAFQNHILLCDIGTKLDLTLWVKCLSIPWFVSYCSFLQVFLSWTENYEIE